MTRISTLSSNQNLVSYMMRNQELLNKYNVQLTTNQVSQNYSGIATSSQRLVSMETSAAVYQSFKSNNEVADIRLGIGSTVMEGASATIDDFRQTLKDYLAVEPTENNTATVQDWAFRTMKDLESYLNTEADGR